MTGAGARTHHSGRAVVREGLWRSLVRTFQVVRVAGGDCAFAAAADPGVVMSVLSGVVRLLIKRDRGGIASSGRTRVCPPWSASRQSSRPAGGYRRWSPGWRLSVGPYGYGSRHRPSAGRKRYGGKFLRRSPDALRRSDPSRPAGAPLHRFQRPPGCSETASVTLNNSRRARGGAAPQARSRHTGRWRTSHGSVTRERHGRTVSRATALVLGAAASGAAGVGWLPSHEVDG